MKQICFMLGHHDTPESVYTLLYKGFDGSLYPFDDQKIIYRLAIPKANRYMMDHCTYLISYCHKSNGNTAKLIKYALKLEAEGKIKTILL